MYVYTLHSILIARLKTRQVEHLRDASMMTAEMAYNEFDIPPAVSPAVSELP